MIRCGYLAVALTLSAAGVTWCIEGQTQHMDFAMTHTLIEVSYLSLT